MMLPELQLLQELLLFGGAQLVLPREHLQQLLLLRHQLLQPNVRVRSPEHVVTYDNSVLPCAPMKFVIAVQILDNYLSLSNFFIYNKLELVYESI